jgi:hypothetical protein
MSSGSARSGRQVSGNLSAADNAATVELSGKVEQILGYGRLQRDEFRLVRAWAVHTPTSFGSIAQLYPPAK